MKNLLLMTCLLVSQGLWAKNTNDSLLLKIDKRDQKIIGAKADSKKTLREELEGVFEKKGLVLTDSLWQQIRTVIKTDSDGDSSISVRIGNSSVKIGILKSGVNYKSEIRTKAKPGGVTIESTGKDEVRVGWNGIHVKDGKEEVHVDWNGVHVKEPNGEETKVIWGRDSTKTQSKDKKSNLYERKGFNVYIGLNGLTGKMPENVIAIYPSPYLNSDPELKPLGSRFVSLDFTHAATIARGKKSAFKLGYGFSFDWYNFMFDHNRVVTKATSATNFQPILDTRGDEVALKKNKLTVSYITLPIVPHVVFNKQSAIKMIGLGGYVSYRLDSWTKTIEEKSDDLARIGSNFNLNQVRYGVKAEVALRHVGELFFNYDLAPLFQKGMGPELTAFSFGFKL
ncbi:hypothetical protein U0R10_10075 [Aquirufa sp. OSTEICH-129V]|uniref:PorT family protein n=1 Tax=Aquirufa avitistagni TaxID=3104728 RepID=A0ABW6DDJ9_9BACT